MVLFTENLFFTHTLNQINMLKTTIGLLLSVIIFSSCKKDSNCERNMASIAGTYSLVKLEFGSGGIFADVTSELEACERDDRVTLNANGTSAYADLGTVCSPAGDETGTWSVSSSGRMTINSGGGILDLDDAEISSFDCTTLVLTGFEAGSPGSQFRLTIRK